MSHRELKRRERAFDRLGLSTLAALTICSVDLLATRPVESVTTIVAVSALFLGSRLWLASGNARFAATTWCIEPGTLRREDGRSRNRYQLSSIRGMRAKRTTGGAIREIKLTFDDGSSLFVNGLEDPESFWDHLRTAADAAAQTELREPLDFDHPWFYVALGVVLGTAIAVIERILGSGPQVNERWVYALLAAYSLGLGVYWLRAKPISGRYGPRALKWDVAIAVAVLVLSAALGIAVFVSWFAGGRSA